MNPLKFIAHKILPLVYDESLSYYEVLCKVVAKVNEVIEFVEAGLFENIREVISDLIIDYAYDSTTETLTINIDLPDE